MKIVLPQDVITIIDRLESCGHEAYAVGGCVRDSILGREPEDWDICTNALPDGLGYHDLGIPPGSQGLVFSYHRYRYCTRDCDDHVWKDRL